MKFKREYEVRLTSGKIITIFAFDCRVGWRSIYFYGANGKPIHWFNKNHVSHFVMSIATKNGERNGE